MEYNKPIKSRNRRERRKRLKQRNNNTSKFNDNANKKSVKSMVYVPTKSAASINNMHKSRKYIKKTKMYERKVPKWLVPPNRDLTEESRDFLINGYLFNILNINNNKNNYNNITKTINHYLKPLSSESERAIVSANFFANIINEYQTDENNKCEFIKNESERINLLNYIFIRGGALRDSVLSRNINDIDFVIDIKNLTKVYYQHLVKYHNKNDNNQQSLNCKCYLWQRYLNMVKYTGLKEKRYADIDGEMDEIKKLEKNMVRSNFLLNARFFKDIIVSSKYNTEIPFINAIDAINTWGYTNWVINIDKKLFYHGIDLKGARFDIGDEMSNSYGMTSNFTQKIVDKNEWVFKANWNKCFDYLWYLKFPMEMKAKNVNISDYDNKFLSIKRNHEIVRDKSISLYNENNKDVISINLPIYGYKMLYSHQACDFTINGLRIPLNNVYDPNFIDFNWYSKIFEYSYNNSNNMRKDDEFMIHNKMAIDDLKNKVIRQPSLHILNIDYLYDDYFWRFIKILTKFIENIYYKIWKIDEKTLKAVKAAQKEHFRALNDDKMREFINRLLFWNINDDNFKIKVKKRLQVFRLINIDRDIKNAFKSYPNFKLHLESAIVSRLDDDKKLFMINTFKEFGYDKNLLSNIKVAKVTNNNNQKKRKRKNNAYNSNQNNTTYSTRKF